MRGHAMKTIDKACGMFHGDGSRRWHMAVADLLCNQGGFLSWILLHSHLEGVPVGVQPPMCYQIRNASQRGKTLAKKFVDSPSGPYHMHVSVFGTNIHQLSVLTISAVHLCVYLTPSCTSPAKII